MKIRLLAFLALTLMFFSFEFLPAFAQKSDDQQKKLIGTWRGGWPDAKQPMYEIVITSEKIVSKDLRSGKDMGEGTFKLDPKAKTFDATGTAGKDYKGKTFLGIYSLDGDTLKWCSNNGTKDRPKDLVNKPGADHYLLVLNREKR